MIEDEEVGKAYAHNKKEAKKKAAEDAIKRFLPPDYVSLMSVSRLSILRAVHIEPFSEVTDFYGFGAIFLGTAILLILTIFLQFIKQQSKIGGLNEYSTHLKGSSFFSCVRISWENLSIENTC